jgi:putative ABC transport system substrate-binding protein
MRGPRSLPGIIALFVLSLLTTPLAADGQQPVKLYRIGWLGGVAPTTPEFKLLSGAFGEGLREHGYIEGQNLVIERRWTGGQIERSPSLAAELVSLKVDLIVAVGNARARAAKQATSVIPIVMVYVIDPVNEGLVASLAQPGANVTGVTMDAGLEVLGKHLELLKEAAPKVSRVAILYSPDSPNTPAFLRETQAASRGLGVRLQFYEVRDPKEFDSAFAAMTKARAGALLVLPHPFIYVHARRIADLAAKSRLPAVYPFREAVEAGGLMAYAANAPDMFRRAGAYVDKILKGAKPADLPVEQPTKFELVININTAKALGLKVPQSVLIRADEVIQ